jgi:hypothetical protein
MKTCEYRIFNFDEDGHLRSHLCGERACMRLDYPSGEAGWYCAQHYDAVTDFWRSRVKRPMYPVDEERYREVLRLNREPVNATS